MSNQNGSLQRGQQMNIFCKGCGKKVDTFVVGDYRYGSPIKTCPKCKAEYINPVYHEIETDGISPDAFDIKKLLIVLLIGVIFFVISAAMHYYEVTTLDYYHTIYIAIMVISIIVILFAIGDIILIKTGLKEKRNERKRQESVQRMSNPEYALKLREFGYNVPQKYIPEEDTVHNKTEI
ncbi:MAG: hypothetical protein IJZ51_01470 [Ruminiclostridium sp.]|nr:hypothetical protein [Ruminiclostridium sp.]